MRPESLKAKLSEDKVNQLQNEIILTLEAGLENAREANFLKTRLANEEVAPLLQAYLGSIYELKSLPKVLRNGWAWIEMKLPPTCLPMLPRGFPGNRGRTLPGEIWNVYGITDFEGARRRETNAK